MTDPRILPVDLASPLADVVAPLLLPTADSATAAASIIELIDRELDRRGFALTTRHVLAELDRPPVVPIFIARRVEAELKRRRLAGRDVAHVIGELVENVLAHHLDTPDPSPAPSALPPAIVGGAVRFDDLEAFVRELERDRELVERGIVRIAIRRRPTLRGTFLTLVAGAIVAGRYVKLAYELLDQYGHAASIEAELIRRLEAIGLQAREGLIEGPKDLTR